MTGISRKHTKKVESDLFILYINGDKGWREDMPFLSVIVPIYNAEEYLEECLDSIVEQTFTDFELILVDDGSTDSSGEICEKYKKQHDNIVVIHKINGGSVSARNAGIEVASGEYIGYVDADDKIELNMYSMLCKEAQNNNSDVVICDVWQWTGTERKKIVQEMKGGHYSKRQLTDTIYPNMLYYKKYYQFGLLPAMWNKIFRKNILKKNQFLVNEKITIGEDVACTYFCILDSNSVSYLKGEFLYDYRMNADSQCHIWKNKKIDSTKILLDYLYDRFMQYNNEKLMKQFWYYFCYMVTNLVLEYCRYQFENEQKIRVIEEFDILLDSVLMDKFMQKYKKMDLPIDRKCMIYMIKHYNLFFAYIFKWFIKGNLLFEKIYKVKENLIKGKEPK